MNRKSKLNSSLLAAAASLFLTGFTAMGDEKNHYWEWGWGSYGAGSPLDVARFDWSLINLGNISVNQDTLDHLNRVLDINPKQRFLLRVWPIGGLGKLPDNRCQMTLFDYHYTPGIKEKVLKRTKEQVEFFKNGLKSDSLAGICFLEELPGHITSNSWNRWKKGKPLPWDVQAFKKQIDADLGESFDIMKPEHRLWWGRKYAAMLEEIHRAIKEASGGKRVLYWHQSAMSGTLDALEANEPMIDDFGRSPVPVYYKDIVKPGVCEGIFGYPGKKMCMEKWCVEPAERINCLYFTQLSVAPFMRGVKWDASVKSALRKDSRNLGPFVFSAAGRKTGVWNDLAWYGWDKYYTRVENMRDIEERELCSTRVFHSSGLRNQ